MALNGLPFVVIGSEIQSEIPTSAQRGPWVWAEVAVDIGEPARDLLDRVSVKVSVGYDPTKAFGDFAREAKDAALESLQEAMNLLAIP